MRRRGNWIRLAAVLFTGLAAGAQTIQGPALGFIVDHRHATIRTVAGIPSAASIGAPVRDIDGGISAVSPRGDYIAAISAAGEAELWTPGAAALRKLEGITPGAASIVLSPSGSAAAFYFPDSRRVQVLTGLPDASAPQDILLTPLQSPLKSFALSDDGELLLCAETSAETMVLSAAGDLGRIALTSAATAVAFAPHGRTAVVVSASEALLVRDAGNANASAALPLEGIAGADAAAFSADGATLYFTHRRSVTTYRMGGGQAPAVLECDCRPAGLIRMGTGEVYRLTEYTGAPLRILDGAAATPRIVTIPPAADADNQQ